MGEEVDFRGSDFRSKGPETSVDTFKLHRRRVVQVPPPGVWLG